MIKYDQFINNMYKKLLVKHAFKKENELHIDIHNCNLIYSSTNESSPKDQR